MVTRGSTLTHPLCHLHVLDWGRRKGVNIEEKGRFRGHTFPLKSAADRVPGSCAKSLAFLPGERSRRREVTSLHDWPLGGTCASLIPKEPLDLGRNCPEGDAQLFCPGHSCPHFTGPGVQTCDPCECVLSTGGEGPQACAHRHDGAGMDVSQMGPTVGCQALLHLTTLSSHSINRMGWAYLYFTGEEVEA